MSTVAVVSVRRDSLRDSRFMYVILGTRNSGILLIVIDQPYNCQYGTNQKSNTVIIIIGVMSCQWKGGSWEFRILLTSLYGFVVLRGTLGLLSTPGKT